MAASGALLNLSLTRGRCSTYACAVQGTAVGRGQVVISLWRTGLTWVVARADGGSERWRRRSRERVRRQVVGKERDEKKGWKISQENPPDNCYGRRLFIHVQICTYIYALIHAGSISTCAYAYIFVYHVTCINVI